jgi:hypothetical protein
VNWNIEAYLAAGCEESHTTTESELCTMVKDGYSSVASRKVKSEGIKASMPSGSYSTTHLGMTMTSVGCIETGIDNTIMHGAASYLLVYIIPHAMTSGPV